MDRSARLKTTDKNFLYIAIQAALDRFQSNLWTALPAVVSSYNKDKLTVAAQPTIQAQVFQPNGTWVDTQLPLCLDCPVVFPGGGEFLLTFPMTTGDEGLLIFASRCIDSWWQSGGIQKQAENRMHDLSDGFFIPAMMSQKMIPANVNGNTCQLRTKDGTLIFELDSQTGQVNITAPGGLWINGVMVVVP